MTYFAQNTEQAENGLMFKKDQVYNPDTHKIHFINGEFVAIPREDIKE
jgi:hypothetical protein